MSQQSSEKRWEDKLSEDDYDERWGYDKYDPRIVKEGNKSKNVTYMYIEKAIHINIHKIKIPEPIVKVESDSRPIQENNIKPTYEPKMSEESKAKPVCENEECDEEEWDVEYCDVCGRECDGVHSKKDKKEIEKKEIQKLVKILLSKDEKLVNESIKQYHELRMKKTPISEQNSEQLILMLDSFIREMITYSLTTDREEKKMKKFTSDQISAFLTKNDSNIKKLIQNIIKDYENEEVEDLKQALMEKNGYWEYIRSSYFYIVQKESVEEVFMHVFIY